MKKSGFIFFAVVIVIFTGGCVSSGSAVVLAQRDPIALVSVVSNWDINWKDEDSMDANSPGLFMGRHLRTDPDLVFVSNSEELINTGEMTFRSVVAESKLIELAEKETVLFSRAYGEAKINKQQLRRKDVSPKNYRLIDYRDKKFPPALANETGIQRSMFVEFNFVKFMSSGISKTGNGRAEVNMVVIILDSRGKTVFRKTFSARSHSSIEVHAGTYSGTALIELFESTIKEVCNDFMDHLKS